MNIVRKPESHRGPQLARSANATAAGIRVRGRRPVRALVGRSRSSTSSPSPWLASTFCGSRIAQIGGEHEDHEAVAQRPLRAEGRGQDRRAAPDSPAPTTPASETRALALTSVRSGGSRRGTAAARVTPYALEATRQPSAAGNSQSDSVTTAVASTQQRKRADRHGRADRPAAAVAEAVEERADQRRDDRERQHRQAEEQRDLAAGLAGRDLEEEGAGERDRDGGVAGGVEGVELDQAGEPRVAGALRAGGPPCLRDRELTGGPRAATGRPGSARQPRRTSVVRRPRGARRLPPPVRRCPIGVRRWRCRSAPTADPRWVRGGRTSRAPSWPTAPGPASDTRRSGRVRRPRRDRTTSHLP